MAEVTVTVGGVSRSAVLTWDGALKPMSSTGPGGYCAAFRSAAGTFVYSLVVFGAPSDAWTAKVTDGTNTNNHAGHMSPGGYDTTGDTAFEVT
jgi:hypothetical protein